jgi:cytochrome c oxidase subunit I+III
MTTRDDALPNSLPRPPLELTRLEEVWETPSGWRFFKSVKTPTSA